MCILMQTVITGFLKMLPELHRLLYRLNFKEQCVYGLWTDIGEPVDSSAVI